MAKIEWNYVLGALSLGLIWFLIGYPIIEEINERAGVVVAYTLFLAVYFSVAVLFGRGVHNVGKSVALMMAGVIGFDLLTPPILISLTEPPSEEVLHILSSDTYFYTIFTELGAGHQSAFLLTYPVMVLAGMLVFTFFLSGKQLRKALSSQIGR